MEVILLERVAKLGQMGEVVRVKDGFARNFLLKRGKALRATADNRAKFDGMKSELEARNLEPLVAIDVYPPTGYWSSSRTRVGTSLRPTSGFTGRRAPLVTGSGARPAAAAGTRPP